MKHIYDTDDDYMRHWRMRAIEAEVQVNILKDKLMFWRTVGISFVVVVIVITLLA